MTRNWVSAQTLRMTLYIVLVEKLDKEGKIKKFKQWILLEKPLFNTWAYECSIRQIPEPSDAKRIQNAREVNTQRKHILLLLCSNFENVVTCFTGGDAQQIAHDMALRWHVGLERCSTFMTCFVVRAEISCGIRWLNLELFMPPHQ